MEIRPTYPPRRPPPTDARAGGRRPAMSETTGKKPWLSALPYFVGGDIDGFAAVFSNNLATMLAGCAMLTGPGVLPEDIVYGKIVPGVGISMAFGCVWYVLLTLKTASNLGRTDMCAIPFGINTPGVFAFNAGAQIPSWYWVVNGWSLIDALKTRQLTNTTRSPYDPHVCSPPAKPRSTGHCASSRQRCPNSRAPPRQVSSTTFSTPMSARWARKRPAS